MRRPLFDFICVTLFGLSIRYTFKDVWNSREL
jgi:hypothetical protein